jgi:hypothetical protein
MVEPEETSILRQRLGKRVPAATNKQIIVEVLLGHNDGNGVLCGSARKYARPAGLYLKRN